MGKIFFPSHRWLGEKNGFSSDFDTFSSSEGRGKNIEIGGNNGSFRAPISDRCPEGTSKTREWEETFVFCRNRLRFSTEDAGSPENSMNFRGTGSPPIRVFFSRFFHVFFSEPFMLLSPPKIACDFRRGPAREKHFKEWEGSLVSSASINGIEGNMCPAIFNWGFYILLIFLPGPSIEIS